MIREMIAKVTSGATVGLRSIPVTVEVDVSTRSLPSFTIVGLPSKSVEEARERVRAALKNSGAELPPHRITVNLAPADLPKDGPCYDLPIALGILVASGQLDASIEGSLVYGELSLDGTLRHTKGVLPMALLAKEKGYTRCFFPASTALEAAIVHGPEIYPVSSLIMLFHHLSGTSKIQKQQYISFSAIASHRPADFDFADIKGQEQGKRVMEISAAGGHNVSLKGVPGAGKTMLSRALPSILPMLTEEEALDVTKIYSITGNIPEGTSLITQRPFRAPHHTTSRIGLIGGGSRPMPGEISLAHRGILFCDEFPEFPRAVLEALRQPIEDGIVTISRASGTITYPASFVLVAASNPCPCGYYGDPVRSCRCLPGQIAQYKKRMSGPIMDRIDLHIDLPPVKLERLTSQAQAESSKEIRKRVQDARDMQTKRYGGTSITCNSDLSSRDVKTYIQLSSECISLLQKAVQTMHLSARTYYRVIKVAQTIADLDQVETVLPKHIAEALQYRPKEEM